MTTREKLELALVKPIQTRDYALDEDFDPWRDVISGISGQYSSESDRIFIEALIAVRDRTTFDFIKKEGFAGEFALYVLDGHGYLECGGSPRGGWWDYKVEGLLQPLIDKWQEYYRATWE